MHYNAPSKHPSASYTAAQKEQLLESPILFKMESSPPLHNRKTEELAFLSLAELKAGAARTKEGQRIIDAQVVAWEREATLLKLQAAAAMVQQRQRQIDAQIARRNWEVCQAKMHSK